MGYLFEGVVSVLGLAVLLFGCLGLFWTFFDYSMIRKIGFLRFVSASGFSFFVDKENFLHEGDYS